MRDKDTLWLRYLYYTEPQVTHIFLKTILALFFNILFYYESIGNASMYLLKYI